MVIVLLFKLIIMLKYIISSNIFPQNSLQKISKHTEKLKALLVTIHVPNIQFLLPIVYPICRSSVVGFWVEVEEDIRGINGKGKIQ